MIGVLQAWLRLFRIVNLPTVPGDVMVGAAALFATTGGGSPGAVVPAVFASLFLYHFGLVDNDIVGAKTDVDRPIPQGLVSLRAARIARTLCLAAAAGCASVGRLSPFWWGAAAVLTVAILVYNRTKNAWLMGACRGLNVVLGALAVAGCCVRPAGVRSLGLVASLAALWTLYIGGVTKYSEGEESDPARKAFVGFLIGALIYLQLGVLVMFALMCPRVSAFRPLLLAGAAMLILLRLSRRLLPKVSAS